MDEPINSQSNKQALHRPENNEKLMFMLYGFWFFKTGLWKILRMQTILTCALFAIIPWFFTYDIHPSMLASVLLMPSFILVICASIGYVANCFVLSNKATHLMGDAKTKTKDGCYEDYTYIPLSPILTSIFVGIILATIQLIGTSNRIYPPTVIIFAKGLGSAFIWILFILSCRGVFSSFHCCACLFTSDYLTKKMFTQKTPQTTETDKPN